MKNETHPELEKSEVIEALPLACADETAAVEFFEEQRWSGKPVCPHCQSGNVYKMLDRDGTRNKRYLWRCRGCAEQFTVRINSVYEESRIPLRHWAYAFWRASTSKKGVSAREIQRHCQISYKSALFLLHRVRFALTPNNPRPPKLDGEIEIDETYCGGKPRRGTGKHKAGRGTKKTPVVAMVQRNGEVRTKVVANVNYKNLHRFINKNVHPVAIVNTDYFSVYHNIFCLKQKHLRVNHSAGEYAKSTPEGYSAHVNTAESFFSLIKRGLMGIYHSVSKEHLHRYCGEFEFRWNTRSLNDGERVAKAIQSASGKRLIYG
jgi:transposase-like protein